MALDDGTWTDEVAAELETDDRVDATERVLSATREIHARQADEQLEAFEDVGERFEDRTPVVVQRGRGYDEGSDSPWKPE